MNGCMPVGLASTALPNICMRQSLSKSFLTTLNATSFLAVWDVPRLNFPPAPKARNTSEHQILQRLAKTIWKTIQRIASLHHNFPFGSTAKKIGCEHPSDHNNSNQTCSDSESQTKTYRPKNPPQIPKYQKQNGAFTRTFSKSSRELLPSSL